MKEPKVPPQIETAITYATLCVIATTASGVHSCFQARDLTRNEAATYDAALSALRLYFLGEVEFLPKKLEPDEAHHKAKKKDKHA